MCLTACQPGAELSRQRFDECLASRPGTLSGTRNPGRGFQCSGDASRAPLPADQGTRAARHLHPPRCCHAHTQRGRMDQDSCGHCTRTYAQVATNRCAVPSRSRTCSSALSATAFLAVHFLMNPSSCATSSGTRAGSMRGREWVRTGLRASVEAAASMHSKCLAAACVGRERPEAEASPRARAAGHDEGAIESLVTGVTAGAEAADVG